jgi:hypothetical protein
MVKKIEGSGVKGSGVKGSGVKSGAKERMGQSFSSQKVYGGGYHSPFPGNEDF